METTIRAATADDARFLARVMLLASRSHRPRGFWDLGLAAPGSECLEFLECLALAQTRSWAHYSRYLIAEVDGVPAAGLCGYDPGDAEASDIGSAFLEALRRTGWRPERLLFGFARMLPTVTGVPRQERGVWTVENVGTLPQFRRRGLVSALLARILEEGRTQGYRKAQISLLIGNTAAERAYEKAGFRFTDEKRHPLFQATMGAPGLRRMVRDL